MILYICPQCGAWAVSIGLVEALIQGNPHGHYIRNCEECGAVMVGCTPETRLSIQLHTVEAIEETNPQAVGE